MAWREKKVLWVILLICLIMVSATNSKAYDLNEKAIESWVSTNRFFSNIALEVSVNYFLSEQDTNFTVEPKESTLVTGALLPNSYYVKYDEKAYREKIIQGMSDSNCWAIDIARKMVMSGSKYSAFGGGTTNWTWIATHKQQNRLRDFTQFGFLYIEPGSLQISGTNFIATTSMSASAKPVEGSFADIDEKGIPHSFNYHFVDGRKFSFQGNFEYLDPEAGKFDCIISCWTDNVLQKKIRIKTYSALQPADETELKTIFKPSDFIQAKTTLVESNHVRYERLPSGKLSYYNPDAAQAESRENRQSIVRFVFLSLMIVSTIFFFFVIFSSRRQNSSKNQINKS